MYEVSVGAEFCAAHAITVAGVAEAMHGHNWRVTAVVRGRPDGDGLVCDFHTVEGSLREIVGAFDNRTLNEIEPFTRVNPTAEHLARHIGESLAERLDGPMSPHARVDRVSVTEAPGCVATWIREPGPEGGWAGA